MLGYCGVVRDALDMQMWDVIVHPDVSEKDDIWAETWCSHNHFTINIRFGPDTPGVPDETLWDAIVHEFIHAMHRDVSQAWEAAVAYNTDYLPGILRNDYDRQFHLAMERFVDYLTRRIKTHVPVYDSTRRYPIRERCTLWNPETDVPE